MPQDGTTGASEASILSSMGPARPNPKARKFTEATQRAHKKAKEKKTANRFAKHDVPAKKSPRGAERVVVTERITTIQPVAKRSRTDREKIANAARGLLADLDKKGRLPNGI